MAEDLKPCPFCGKNILTECGLGHNNASIEEWNNAFCWKENAALRAEVERLKEFRHKADLAADEALRHAYNIIRGYQGRERRYVEALEKAKDRLCSPPAERYQMIVEIDTLLKERLSPAPGFRASDTVEADFTNESALLKAREEGKAEAMESEAVKGMRETLKEIGDYGHEDGLYCPRVANEAVAVFDAYKKSLSENQTKGKGGLMEPKIFTLPDGFDWELCAINEIVKLLGNLKSDEQKRIVKYLADRYGAKGE